MVDCTPATGFVIFSNKQTCFFPARLTVLLLNLKLYLDGEENWYN